MLDVVLSLCKLPSNLKHPKIFIINLQICLGIYEKITRRKQLSLIIATKQTLPRVSGSHSKIPPVVRVVDGLLSSPGKYLKLEAKALELPPKPERDGIGGFQD